MLAPDGDGHALAEPIGERLAQQVAPLGDLDQALQALLGRELRLPGDVLRAPQHDAARARRRRWHVEQLVRFLDEDVEELVRVRVRGRVAQPVGEGRPDLAQREPREALVQHHRNAHHRFGRHMRRNLDENSACSPALQGHDEQQPFSRDLQQLQPLELGVAERGAHRHAQLQREHPDHLRRALEDLVHSVALSRQFLTDLFRLRRRDGLRPHERVHVHAIGEVRRDAAGGRVRVIEVALVLQVAHGVPNRRRGKRHAEPL